MPDAWTILKDNSTLASGDAWEHLNNQSGEGGGGGTLTLQEGVAVDLASALDITVDLSEISIEITPIQYTIEVDMEA